MNYSVVEHSIHCPFCDEPMTVLLDLSAGEQSYIEDCQICCRPMMIRFQLEADELCGVQVDCAS